MKSRTRMRLMESSAGGWHAGDWVANILEDESGTGQVGRSASGGLCLVTMLLRESPK